MRERTILVVDDSDADAELARFALDDAGLACRVERADSGSAALDYLRANRERLPALVMLDLKMPGMSGFDVLAELKRDAALRSIFVAVFSSSDEPRDVDRALDLGADAYIPKPSDLDGYAGVARRIGQLLERASPER